MKRHILMLGAPLFLGLAACGAGGGLLDAYTYEYWDSLCGCWVYESVIAPPLFEDGFDSGIRADRWVGVGAPASVDPLEGAPAPALLLDGTKDPAGGAVTTAASFPLENGLRIEVDASPRGVRGLIGGTDIRVRDAVTGDDLASVRVAIAADGSALLTYRIAPPGGAAVEETEAIAAEDLGTTFRAFTFTVAADGSATWLVDRVVKVAFPGVLPATAVVLTLDANSAQPRFDSVTVIGHE